MSNHSFISFVEKVCGYVSMIISVTCFFLTAGIFIMETNLATQRQKIGLALFLGILGILSFWFAYALFKEVRKHKV